MKIIITHQNADYDALASMLAAQKLWPDHHLLISSAVSPSVRQYLALHKDWLQIKVRAEVDAADVERVVIVDTRDKRRLSEYEECIDNAGEVLIFDHHPAGAHDLRATNMVVEPVGACVTLLAERIQAGEVSLSTQEATLLMLGLYADTGSLSFSSTTVRDLQVAAFLLISGASLAVVNRYLQQEFSPEQQQLLVSLMSRIEVIDRKGLRLGLGGCESAGFIKGAARVVERVMQLMGLDACFGALKSKKRSAVQIIGRSVSPLVDASLVAERWGGGGHPSAAAARASGKDLPEVMGELREYLEDLELKASRVRELMSSPVQTVPHDIKLRELKPQLEGWQVSGVPVIRDGQVVGIVSRRDIAEAARREDWEIPAAGFMTHQVISVEPDDPLARALELMTEADVGRLPVVDGEELVGIISRSDVLKHLYLDDD